jgi:hypothetical protein
MKRRAEHHESESNKEPKFDENGGVHLETKLQKLLVRLRTIPSEV